MIFLLLQVWTGEMMLNANGVSFLPPSSSNPIAEDDGDVLLTFTTSHTNPYLEIYFAKINSSGNLLSLINVSRSGSQTSQWAGYPNIVSFDTTYFFVWDDRRISYHELDFQNEVYYRMYFPDVAGGTWLNIMNATENDGEWSINPSATKSGGRVYIAWEDTKDGYNAVYYTNYDGGIWDNPALVSSSHIYAGYPSIVASSSDIMIVYEEVEDSNVVINAYSPTRSKHYQISTRGLNSYFPSIASSGNEIAVVWEEVANGYGRVYARTFNGTWSASYLVSNGYGTMPSTSGFDGIFYYTYVQDGNIIFSSDTSSPEILNESSFNCSYPHIFITSTGEIYVFWNGYTQGYSDMKIFYKIWTPAKERQLHSLVLYGSDAFIPDKSSSKWEVYTIDGRKISTSYSNKISLSGLPEGIYIVRSFEDNILYKLVKLGD